MKAMTKWQLWLACLLLALPVYGCGSSNNGTDIDDPENPTVIVPEEIDRVVIYEAYPGMFGTSNTLTAISGQLDNIKSLGVNILWLMPIYEQGVYKGIGSPYCVKDYKAVNPNYGTLDDLKSLVSAAHGKGMRVILDWVANHTSWDNAWITDHPDWYTQNSDGEIISPPGFDWPDVADLNYDNADMRAAMLDAMKYWVTEADVDGYRCDYAEGCSPRFLGRRHRCARIA
ncbi:MAG: hypothetical protein LUF87_07675 [Alistipes sp.]|nr:hypothetical protein [Alistipes sp.]